MSDGKAGGFLIDTDIVSMYPNLSELSDKLLEDDEDDPIQRERNACDEDDH